MVSSCQNSCVLVKDSYHLGCIKSTMGSLLLLQRDVLTPRQYGIDQKMVLQAQGNYSQQPARVFVTVYSYQLLRKLGDITKVQLLFRQKFGNETAVSVTRQVHILSLCDFLISTINVLSKVVFLTSIEQTTTFTHILTNE